MLAPSSDASKRNSARHALPLRWLLPLLTTGVVVAVLATALILSSTMLRRAALETAQDRLRRSVHQLTVVSATAVRQLTPQYAAVMHDPVIRRAAETRGAGSNPDSVRRILEQIELPNDSGLPVELWSSSGRRIAFAGRDLQTTIENGQPPEIPDHLPLQRAGLDSIRTVDSVQLGALHQSNGRVQFWIVAPVFDHDRAIGYVLKLQRVAASAQTERTLRELSGTSVAAFYRNVDGKFWASINGRAVPAPKFPDDGSIVAEERIAGTPLVMVLALRRQDVLVASNALMRRLTLLAIALSILGAVLAWLLGRRVAIPLANLTRAAESLAQGDFAARVPMRGPNEVAQLSASFNHMAAQLGGAAAELEQREAEFRALANAIPQLAWMADASGSIFWYNQRWYEFTGTTLQQMEGWGWQSVHDPALLPKVLDRWREAIRLGQRFEMEFTLRGADGMSRWFLTRVEPVRARDGEVVRWFGTNTDIEDLREARESARAASRAKSDFLATMSHELRTPLNAIAGYVELMEMELRGPVTDEQRRDLARIRASQQHLLSLIGGVLDLSRIESGKVAYDLRHIAIDPLLSGLDALIAPQAAAKALALTYERAAADLIVVADHEKLRQVMLNLLSNAIRYTPSGGQIDMCASGHDALTVAITVRDSGPGIRMDQQAQIFEPFVQLDRSLTQTREGVGLGLAISRDLARGMNGELSVDSVYGEGASFTLILPRGRADHATLPTHERNATSVLL